MEKINTNISPEVIQRQLQSLLNCEQLKNSQVLSKFLEYIVSEKLSGREEKIKEYTIGLKALGKPSDFNPQLDAIVRIHAGRLRRIVRQYYQEIGMNDDVIIDIPKGTYVPSFEMRYPKVSGITSLVHEGNRSVEYTTHNSLRQHLNKPVVAVLPFHNLSSENSMNYFVDGIGEQLSIELARFENISVLSYYSTHQYDAVAGLHELKKKCRR